MAATGARDTAIDPTAAKINNEYYSEIGDSWWDTSGPLRLLHDMNPTRVSYFDGVLRAHYTSRATDELMIMDIGCGGGLVSEALARVGYQVTGIDLSEGAIKAARRHAAASGVTVQYRIGSAYELPAADGTLDAVVISDVLEHLHDLPLAISELARVLKPGGLVLFDTINRTVASYLITVLMAERVLRFIHPGTHNWSMFIRPGELRTLFGRSALALGDLRGLVPRVRPGRLVAAFRGGSLGDFTLSDSLRTSYIGHAVKRSSCPDFDF
jgi:2-polyprenyl-6-hydroxyphenyl methylase / 3-demethylubiquinone-9 3-methyltransferase